MSEERDRAPLSTEVSPLETDDDPYPSGSRESKSPDAERVPGSSDGSETARPAVRLTIGQRLSGRYRLERELGEGGMGVVYLATDEQVAGETFAIKVLKEAVHPEALELLREEVRKTRKLSHPNIVDVHSVNVDGRKLYVLMEYLEGKSLSALLEEEFGRGMPFSHAWPIIEDVGAALGHAHDHNVIHSDLKPANIFVTTAGRTKLLDFGIARVSRGPRLHKGSGLLALTPAYASCEMLEVKEADRRDDIYSFACVIYEILSGEHPFGDLTALEAREVGTRVPSLSVLSRGQNAALAKALAFDREARTASVEKLLEGLVADQKPRARTNAVLGGGIIAVTAALVLGYWALSKLLIPTSAVVVQGVPSSAQPLASRATTTAATFSPPPHSIAVLPFVNISGDKEQQYFSDGLTEELLDSLSRINELQVAARTSSFSFQDEHPDIKTVAHKLNVASVLEGSVRRSGNTIRVSAQLNSALTGFHLWRQTYDRDLGDVLRLQTEIADAVTSALKVTLLGDIAARIELGGTRNPAAFDAYLRGLKASNMVHDAKDIEAAIGAYAEAIRLDPNYALAGAARSVALNDYADNFATGPAIRASYESAQTDARLAIARAPALPDGYVALANVLVSQSFDFTHAAEQYERAVSLAPGNAQAARRYGNFAVLMGHTDAGLAATRRAVQLDPLNPAVHRLLSFALRMARRYQEAIEAAQGALALDADNPGVLTTLGMAYYALGDYKSARAACEGARPRANPSGSYYGIQVCLAITYAKLGRHADAVAMLTTVQSWYGDRGAYQYAEIYSQWGDTPKALAWLEKSTRLGDSGLVGLKVDSLLDPLRNEPRFQVIQRALRFPP
ncbi:MAG TPA: protein kinase [Steroidobacteraceae bacterium]|nr:protein kinase [Steroidobacteraceae bacterium]